MRPATSDRLDRAQYRDQDRKGGQLARSAAPMRRCRPRRDYVILRLNSGEQRLVHGRCMRRSARCPTRSHELSIGKAAESLEGPDADNRGIT